MPAQTIVQFDPSAVPAIVPSPNDLAIDRTTGKVNAPIDPNSSPAQQEFTRDYLNSLNGFPTTAGASASVTAPLKPESVTAATVRVLPLNAVAVATFSPTPAAGKVTPVVAWDATTNRVTVTPNPAWPKGSQWGVAIIGGANGVQSADGSPVVPSSTWALLQSPEPLANCPAGSNGQPDFTSDSCTLGTNLIPSNVIDSPEARFADQLASAKRLEQLRLSYKPALDKLAAAGIAREDIVLFWTWTTVAQPEPAFDPAGTTPLGRILPFPTNLALTQFADGGTQVALPTTGATGSQLQLLQGLNTLDGFSTTGHIVTENTDQVPALVDGRIVTTDGGVVANGALIAQASSSAELKTAPSAFACVNCRSSPLADGGTQTLQQLQIVPSAPLDERSVYVAALSTDAPATITLADGTTRTTTVMAPAAWALLRMKSPLVDASGKSLITGVPDANAAALEPIRKNVFQGALDAVEATVPRTKMAMGTVFKTQSTQSVLKQLQALPKTAYAAQVPGVSVYFQDITAQVGSPPGVQVFSGSAFFPVAVTGRSKLPDGSFVANGTLNPTQPVVQRAPFILTVPNSGATPSGGFPVTMFGHGLTRNRTDVLAIASALAQGRRAAVSIDTIFHGERSLCVGAATWLNSLPTTTPTSPGSVFRSLNGGGPATSDNDACNNGDVCDADATSQTFGRCVGADPAAALSCGGTPPALDFAAGDATCRAAGQGLCLPTGKCEGGDFLRIPAAADPFQTPFASGNILNLGNIFATRDNFRQQVIDLAQMQRVLSSSTFDAQVSQVAGGAVALNDTQMDYVGQSLGGILGTLYTSVSPDIHRSVLNVPGADPAGILSTSPSFAPSYAAFKAGLAANGVNEGTPAFDNFINFARWILDPADPQNSALYLKNGTGKPTDRDVLIQYITEDQTIPNPQTDKLITAANRQVVGAGAVNECKVAKWNPAVTAASTLPSASSPGLKLSDRHGFLLNFAGAADASERPSTFTAAAQGQAVTFLGNGTVTPIPAAAK